MEYRKQFGEGIVGRTEFHQLCEDDPDWRQCAIFERPDGNSAGLKGDNLVAVVNERIADTVIAALKAGSSPRVLTCVYCGQEYPPGTPASQHQALFEHVRTCPKHPLAQVVEILDRLTTSVSVSGDHHESEVSKDFVAAGENQGNADAYTHVAGCLSAIVMKLKAGDYAGALADAKKFGDECPKPDADEEGERELEEGELCERCGARATEIREDEALCSDCGMEAEANPEKFYHRKEN
jgi:hypothetical protein